MRISEGFCSCLPEGCLSLRDDAGCRQCFSTTLCLPAQGHRCSHSLAVDGLPAASALCFMRLGLPLISFPFYLSSAHPARNVSQGCIDCLLNPLNSCCCQKNILSLLLCSILLASLILSRRQSFIQTCVIQLWTWIPYKTQPKLLQDSKQLHASLPSTLQWLLKTLLRSKPSSLQNISIKIRFESLTGQCQQWSLETLFQNIWFQIAWLLFKLIFFSVEV